MKSKKYVERYLDATKSNMLFAKGIIFVEGIAELLLIPCLAECMGLPIETHHVAVVAVDGVTFKHFLPIFGAVSVKELRQFALPRPVACIIDPDPARQEKAGGAKRKKCWPYQLGCNSSDYEYWPTSATANNLLEQCKEASNIQIYYGTKTLEYDLALDNHRATVLITPTCTHGAELRQLAEIPADLPPRLRQKLEQEDSSLMSDIETIADPEAQQRARFATCYLLCTEEFKGEHAFDLTLQLRENHAKPDHERVTFQVPVHIGDAIWWACNQSDEK
jgi:putative ATP-dependent endonuclease of OLD family